MHTWYDDLDGSLTGTEPGSTVQPWTALIPQSCPAPQGEETVSVCSTSVPKLFNFESGDEDCCGFHRRDLGNMHFLVERTGASTLSFTMREDTDCARGVEFPSSYYAAALPAGERYHASFLATTELPRLIRLYYFSDSFWELALLTFDMYRYRQIRVYVGGILQDLAEKSVIPDAGSPAGSFFRNTSSQQMHIMLRGSSYGGASTAVVVQLLEMLLVGITLGVDIANLRFSDFTAAMAGALSLDEERLVVTDAGEVPNPLGRRLTFAADLPATLVKFEIGENAPAEPSATDMGIVASDSAGAESATGGIGAPLDPLQSNRGKAATSLRSLAGDILEMHENGELELPWPVLGLEMLSVPPLPESALNRLVCEVDPVVGLVCRCPTGFYGAECEFECSCNHLGSSGCSDGPEGVGTCHCLPGWDGDDCSFCLPHFYTVDTNCSTFCSSATNCSGHGICSISSQTGLPQGCECNPPWVGLDCSALFCRPEENCNSNGICDDVTGHCICNEGWTRSSCDRCDADYYPEGACDTFCDASTCIPPSMCDVNGVCQCAPGRFGSNCAGSCPDCLANSSTGCDDGRLGAGTCSCVDGYRGERCEQQVSWQPLAWGNCEGLCGGYSGTRRREVLCLNDVTQAIEDGCFGDPPHTSEACETEPCRCASPPAIANGDFEAMATSCPAAANGQLCDAICESEYEAFAQFRCQGGFWVELALCIPPGASVTSYSALFSVLRLQDVDTEQLSGALTDYADSTRVALISTISNQLNIVSNEVLVESTYEVLPPDDGVSEGRRLQMADLGADFYVLAVAVGIDELESRFLQMLEHPADVKANFDFYLLNDCNTWPNRCVPPVFLDVLPPIRTMLHILDVQEASSTLPPAESEDKDGNNTLVIILVVLLIVALLCGCCCCVVMTALVVAINKGYIGKGAASKIQQLPLVLVRAGSGSTIKSGDGASTASTADEANGALILRQSTDGSGGLELALVEEPWTVPVHLHDEEDAPGRRKIEMRDGRVYEGDVLEGQPHGEGCMTWTYGKSYKGQWVAGLPDGQGMMHYSAEETWIYAGNFRTGLRHGLGRCEWGEHGSWYAGEWVSGVQNGLGEVGEDATPPWSLEDANPRDSCLQPPVAQIWKVENGEEVESLANSHVSSAHIQDPLTVVTLEAMPIDRHYLQMYESGEWLSFEHQLEVPLWGFAVGQPESWMPTRWGALLITRVYKDGCLDRWNKALVLKQPGEEPIRPGSFIWVADGFMGPVSHWLDKLLDTENDRIRLEIRHPPAVRIKGLMENLEKRQPLSKPTAIDTTGYVEANEELIEVRSGYVIPIQRHLQSEGERTFLSAPPAAPAALPAVSAPHEQSLAYLLQKSPGDVAAIHGAPRVVTQVLPQAAMNQLREAASTMRPPMPPVQLERTLLLGTPPGTPPDTPTEAGNRNGSGLHPPEPPGSIYDGLDL